MSEWDAFPAVQSSGWDAFPVADAPQGGALSDILPEMGNTLQGHLSNIGGMYGGTSKNGPLQQQLNVGKGMLSLAGIVPDTLIGAPLRSVLGHGMANAEHAVGKVIAPETAAKDNPAEMYETAKGNVNTALAGLGYRGGLRTVPPIESNIPVSPKAQKQLARAVQESGLTPDELAARVSGAANEGQGMFTLADALGNPGQRMLSTITRSPGVGRTEAIDFLESRQAGQGRRVSNILSEGFGSPQTAAQAEDAIVSAARQVNAPAYRAAYEAGDVPVWSNTLERLSSSPTIRNAMRGAERKWADWQIIDGYGGMNPPARVENGGILRFDGRGLSTYPNLQYWDYVARDLAGKAQAARNAGNRQEAARFGNLERLLKEELDRIVPQFRATRAGARQFFNAENAVEAGSNAAKRGRTEDTVPGFRALGPQEQGAFRAGYIDPLIADVQGAASGVNKARQFTSDAFRTESAAVAPLTSGNQMLRRIDRENTMFETRNQAVGGSRTADNLSDAAAFGIDPKIVSNILHGNWKTAAVNLMRSAANAVTGNSAAVRQEVGKILLSRGGNVTERELGGILATALRRVQDRQPGRGILGAVSIGSAGSRN